MRRLVVLCSLMFASATLAQSGDFKVIVHPDNPLQSLSAQQVSDFLLKKSVRWQNGTQAEPIDLPSSSQTRQEFSKVIHGRSLASIKNYWQRQIFAGRSVPPPEVSDDSEVITFVRSHPGAIGYVAASAATDGVQVVTLANE